ncbi:MAG TPA: TonB-dependent receptor plug domain-containing protein, partial [Chitinophagaceae bacterium]
MKGSFTFYDRMYKKLCFLLLMACCGATGYAQQQLSIKGVVLSSENNQAIPGATVRVAGTSNGTLTDYQGKYSISANSGDTLIISSLGFMEKHIGVRDQARLNVILRSAASRLNELVVVSYGTSRERDITGSVTKVSAKSVQDLPVAEFGQMLQGKVAGLQANQVTGIPGEGMTFRIRGAASLGAGNQPLIVVDGQPITGDVTTINPDDIESFSVLKDASATALYGSRATNGVIIITTKHAKIGTTSVSLDAYYGVQEVPQKGRPDLMNAREFATFMKGFYEDKIKYEGWKNPSTGLAEVPKD